MTATTKQMRAAVTLLAVCIASRAFALKVHQDTDFTQKTISNIAVMSAVTGLVTYVPQASASMPVPFWQLTNYVDAATNAIPLTPTASIVSGECDTNLVEILFSTNYLITSLCVYQPTAVSRTVYVYTNAVQIDSFAFSTIDGVRAFGTPIAVTRHHRLGIAVSGTNSVVSFCFEGRRR